MIDRILATKQDFTLDEEMVVDKDAGAIRQDARGGLRALAEADQV